MIVAHVMLELQNKKLTEGQDSAMYIGALASMHGVADTAEDIVWDKSGMKAIVERRQLN